MGQRAAVLHCLLSSSGFYHCWGIWQDRKSEEEKESETPWLPPSAEAALCRAMLPFHLETRLREERDSHFKRQFDLRSTQENNLKEDLRKQLKGEYKGHTVARCWTVKSGNPRVCAEEELKQGHETLDSLNFADCPFLLWSCHLNQLRIGQNVIMLVKIDRCKVEVTHDTKETYTVHYQNNLLTKY